MRSLLFGIMIPLLSVGTMGCHETVSSHSGEDTVAVCDTQSQVRQKREHVTLAFVGDVMMGTNFPDSISYITRDRGKSIFKDCDSILTQADVAIANLEGTLYDGTEGELRQMTNPRTYFIFRMPGDHVHNLVNAGIDALGIANNHAGDFGPTGKRRTQETLRKAGLQFSGQKDMAEETIIVRDGVRYGYLAFAASCKGSLDMLNAEQRDSLIRKTRPQCDVLVVTFHGGAEGATHTHVPFREEFYVGEDRGNVYEFAHKCIDLGADIVVGHGPHVPRAMELYKGHLIAYSLGNFATPYRMGTGGLSGQAPLLRVELNPTDGALQRGEIHSYLQQQGVGPRKDNAHTVAHTIRQLTLSDFPQSGLTIEEDGKFYPTK